MKVQDEQLYHGAALIQIAEHKLFTAINALKIKGKLIRKAYRINDDIAVYLKYRRHSNKTYGEYNFVFDEENFQEIDEVYKKVPKLYIALVCVKDREICCLSYRQLQSLINRRANVVDESEKQYTILVQVDDGKRMRVYVNKPGRRGIMLGKPMKVSRNAFPKKIFSS